MDYNKNDSGWRQDDLGQSGGSSSYPPPYQPGNSQVVLREVRQRSENNLSVASLVLGIVTLVFFWLPFISVITGIIGMVIAIIALIKEEHKVMAIIGMVLSILGVALSAIMILGYIVSYLGYTY